MCSGSIDGTVGSRWNANDVVLTEQSLGRVDECFDLEFKSSTFMGIPHGISSVSNVTTALSGNPVESAQSSEEFKIEQKVQGSLALSKYKIKKVYRLEIEIENIPRIAFGR